MGGLLCRGETQEQGSCNIMELRESSYRHGSRFGSAVNQTIPVCIVDVLVCDFLAVEHSRTARYRLQVCIDMASYITSLYEKRIVVDFAVAKHSSFSPFHPSLIFQSFNLTCTSKLPPVLNSLYLRGSFAPVPYSCTTTDVLLVFARLAVMSKRDYLCFVYALPVT
jgi:hypothetical protein